VPVHRSLAARRPGLDYIRDQQEAGFVGKDDVGAQPRSVFFTRGHSFCFQRSIASSFRSTARFSGFLLAPESNSRIIAGFEAVRLSSFVAETHEWVSAAPVESACGMCSVSSESLPVTR
jgi:hypothetical protein